MPKHQWSSPTTVKELILDLLQYPMDSPVMVEYQEEHGNGDVLITMPILQTWQHDDEPHVSICAVRDVATIENMDNPTGKAMPGHKTAPASIHVEVNGNGGLDVSVGNHDEDRS
jgi:hypothetical protein